MAHSFKYKHTGITLTSFLYDEWGINVDGSFVDVRIYSPGNAILLNERFYATSGTACIYDVGSLIENDMRKSGIQYADYTVQLIDQYYGVVDTCVVHALYCDRFSSCSDAEAFLEQNFLTTHSIRRVNPDAVVDMYYFQLSADSEDARVAYRWRSSDNLDNVRADAFSLSNSEGIGIHQIRVSLDDVVSHAASEYGLRYADVEIVSFTIAVGQRSVTCFVDNSLKFGQSFMFRNCFNVWEIVSIPGISTFKTEVERSEAIVNNKSLFYDQTTNKSCEFQSGPLTSDEAEWIDQLFTSFEVLKPALDSAQQLVYLPIVITDSQCEVNDDDDKPNSVKFTWRYVDNRPFIRLSTSTGIFTSPYDIVFS